MGVSTSDSIIVVGAGASGLSVALHLALRGYTNISVFAKDDYIPFGDLTNVVYPQKSFIFHKKRGEKKKRKIE